MDHTEPPMNQSSNNSSTDDLQSALHFVEHEWDDALGLTPIDSTLSMSLDNSPLSLSLSNSHPSGILDHFGPSTSDLIQQQSLLPMDLNQFQDQTEHIASSSGAQKPNHDDDEPVVVLRRKKKQSIPQAQIQAVGMQDHEEPVSRDKGKANANANSNDEDEEDAFDRTEHVPDSVRTMMQRTLAVGRPKTKTPKSARKAPAETDEFAPQITHQDQEAIFEIRAYDNEMAEGLLEEIGMVIGQPGGKPKRDRRRRATGHVSQAMRSLPDEVKDRIGEANLAYVQGQFEEARDLFQRVIQQAPHVLEAWKSLAMVYDELKEPIKAMQAYMFAAHLSPKDAELWTRLGMISKSLNQLDQADYCFGKAIKADRENIDALWERALIHIESGRTEKAIRGLSALLDIIPYTMHVVKELARLYLQIGETYLAIRLFEEAIQADEDDIDNGVLDARSLNADGENTSLRVGYEELNMLAELYLEQADYERVILCLKEGVYRILGSDPDNLHEDDDDDLKDELDLPIELRVKIGIARLFLDDHLGSSAQFNIMYEFSVEDYGELYFDVAEAYMKIRRYSQALTLFSMLRENESTNTKDVWINMAQCYKELARYDEAIELFQAYIDEDNGADSIDAKMALSEIYRTQGEDKKARQLLAQADKERKSRQASCSKENRDGSVQSRGGNTTQTFIVKEDEDSLRKRRMERDRALKQAREQALAEENLDVYGRIKDLVATSVEMRDAETDATVLRFMKKLLSRYENAVELYPKNRLKKFHLTNVGRKVLPQLLDDEEQTLDVTMNSKFQGLTFTEWRDLFFEYALLATRVGRGQDAHAMLSSLARSIVFYQNKEFSLHVKLVILACAIHSGDFQTVSDIVRYIMLRGGNDSPLHTSDNQSLELGYNLYNAVFAGRIQGIFHYGSSLNYRFIRRLTTNEGAASSPLMHFLLGHIFVVGRAYRKALGSYFEALKAFPENPTLYLCIGLNFIHRAMQRQAGSRHALLLEAFAYLFQYESLRGSCAETEFNLGRAFHQIGLHSLAVEYYARILSGYPSTEKTEFHSRAAYNLSLIYMRSGNDFLAGDVVRKFCRVRLS